MRKTWDRFEWDDPDRKNGNVQHLRERGIEPMEAEECFFQQSTAIAKMRGGSMTSTCWMATQIEEDV